MEAYSSPEKFIIADIIKLVKEDKLNTAKNMLKKLLVECPDIVEIKLLYSLVLSRMGDFQLAHSHLQEFLSNAELDSDQIEEINKYLSDVVDSTSYN